MSKEKLILQKFITIEGSDGAGKSTFIPVIKSFIESLGEEVVITREPGGTYLGEQLRQILLHEPMGALAETLLMFGARSQHIEEVIMPALKQNKWVLCDRFTDSTIAYQCYGKGLQEEYVRSLQKMVQGDLMPGMTFIFDVPSHIAKQRLLKTGKSPDKFESASDGFKESVANGYKYLARQNPKRCKLIDSSASIEETKKQVVEHLEDFILSLATNLNYSNKIPGFKK